jgi:anhydro-N-acetylmuramic acid kinase
MSGTSLDGLDIVLTDSSSFQALAFTTLPYPKPLQQRLAQLAQSPQTPFNEVALIDRELGMFFSDAVAEFLADHQIQVHELSAIGSHGQTVLHNPSKNLAQNFTVQLGDVSFLAARFNVPVVSDFRHNDMALGGQGAPLAPLFHGALFDGEHWACINMGGISNVSMRRNNQLRGYDIGPANRLIDLVMECDYQRPYDMDGQVAETGQVDEATLAQMLAEPYFALAAPKSTGRELFNQGWLNNIAGFGILAPQDKVATLTELTARTISNELLASTDLKNVWLCGGGALNGYLCQRLRTLMPAVSIQSTDAIGVDPQSMEALLIAWLAYQRTELCRLDLTKVTGAKRPSLLGTITQI